MGFAWLLSHFDVVLGQGVGIPGLRKLAGRGLRTAAGADATWLHFR